MTTTYTRRFRWPIPDFLSEPWHALFQTLVQSMDRTAYAVFMGTHSTPWANSTVYNPGDMALDTVLGSIWIANIAHTSAASPTAFSIDRLVNPLYWTDLAPEIDATESATAAAASAAAAAGASAAASQALKFSRSAKQRIEAVVGNASSSIAASVSTAMKIAKTVKQTNDRMQSLTSIVSAYAADTARNRRRAAASAASLTDDQIIIRNQVFS